MEAPVTSFTVFISVMAKSFRFLDFEFNNKSFAIWELDLKILRYQIPGWNDLSLKEQKLVYYLTQAGLSGRDIMWNMNYRHNLKIRTALEQVYTSFSGDKNTSQTTSDNYGQYDKGTPLCDKGAYGEINGLCKWPFEIRLKHP